MKFVRVSTFSIADAEESIDGPAIDANQLFAVSVQAVVGTTAEGTIKLQASNDIPPADNSGQPPANWSDIPSATIALDGSSGAFLIPKTELAYRWIRVVFTYADGEGTVVANVMALSL